MRHDDVLGWRGAELLVLTEHDISAQPERDPGAQVVTVREVDAQLGQFDDAVTQYQAALKTDPLNNAVRLNLAYFVSVVPSSTWKL